MGTSGGSAKGVTAPISTMVLVSISSDRQNTAAGAGAPVSSHDDWRSGGAATDGQVHDRGPCCGQHLPAPDSTAHEAVCGRQCSGLQACSESPLKEPWAGEPHEPHQRRLLETRHAR